MSAFGTKRTSQLRSPMSAFGGKADIQWLPARMDFAVLQSRVVVHGRLHLKHSGGGGGNGCAASRAGLGSASPSILPVAGPLAKPPSFAML
jgi:hypothetical protein